MEVEEAKMIRLYNEIRSAIADIIIEDEANALHELTTCLIIISEKL